MPKALEIDWSTAKALYVAGIEPNAIAGRLGIKPQALYKRVQRGEWQKMREEIKTLPKATAGVAVELSPAVQIAAELLAAQREQFLAAGGDVALKGMSKLKKHASDAEGVTELDAVGDAAEKFTRIGKVIFGLNDGQQVQVGLQVNILNELPEEGLFPGQPINVTPKEGSEGS